MPAQPLPLPRHPGRLPHLEGLRGLACVSVLLLHGFGDFLPALVPGLVEGAAPGLLGAVGHSPLRLLYDGDSAVFLFFALSGYVLTPGFLRGTDHPARRIAARLLRFLPGVAAATLLAWGLLRLCGDLHLRAADLAGGGWLAGGWEAAPTIAALLRDAFANVLLLGYRGLSPLDALLPGQLWPDAAAFDPPLWTLSQELLGSILVLALATLRRRAPRLWAPALALAALLLLRSPFLCFLAGHAAAIRPLRLPRWPTLAAGLALCLDAGGTTVLGPVATLPLPIAPALDPALMQRGFGAILVFLALHHHRGGLLETPAALWLGRLSFPLYLIHWPMLHGPGAAMALALAPLLPAPAATTAGLLTGLALAFAAAAPLARLDSAALGFARRLMAGAEPGAQPAKAFFF